MVAWMSSAQIGLARAVVLVGSLWSAAGGREVSRRLRRLRLRLRQVPADAGMSTAEYAVGTIAACAFAAVLYQVVTGDSIVSALRDLIASALSSLS